MIIILSLMGIEMAAPLGNMLAKKEHQSAKNSLRLLEYLSNSLSVVFMTCTALLIVPFVMVYTIGIHDVSYYRPIFAYLICAAHFLSIIRSPFQSFVYAAGHFKQTRNGAFVEMGIKIIISLVLVRNYGIVGVAIGSVCSIGFRTLQYAIYVSKNIIERSLWEFAKKTLFSMVSAVLIIIIVQHIPEMKDLSYESWVLHAFPVFGVSIVITALFSALFYRIELHELIETIHKIISNKR